MKLGLLAILCAAVSCITGGDIRVSPDTDQSLPVNSPSSVTFVCNVTGDDVMRRAIWEVEGRQIQSGSNPTRTVFENIGIFIEQVEVGLVNLVVNRDARIQYMETGVRIRCVAFTATEPLEFGPFLFIRVYGRPEMPGDLRLVASKPTSLVWSRPTNIPADVQVSYTITINSTTSDMGGEYPIVDMLQFSIQFLEDELSGAEECEGFMFFVTASVVDAEDSMAAVTMDTVPLSTNVSFIDSSLEVDSVLIRNGGTAVTATVSFQAVESCSVNFPIRNYTLLVDDSLGPTIPATPTDTIVMSTLNSDNLSILVPDKMFQIGVKVCSDVTCRNSTITVPLNTSDVQTASVIFYENNVFLSCAFAEGSTARGCVFTLEVNQNGTGSDQFVLLQSLGGQQCNVTSNQRNGYMDISVLDLESDGVTQGQLTMMLDAMVLESGAEYTQLTGCTLSRDTSRVASIVVPIVVVLSLVAVLIVIAAVLLVLYRKQKLTKEAVFVESEFPDTLSVTIKSDHQKLLANSPLTRRSTVQSLPLTSHHMPINPQRSLPRFHTDNAPISFSVPPERPAPIEVELHGDSVKLKLNKSALRAVARFHYMAARRAQSNEGVAPDSLTSLEGQSLLAMSNISRVHITDEFKSICCELPPVEEGGEEEEELKSWGIINTPPRSPPLKDELSSV